MLKAAPNVTRILLRNIPGAANVADIIADAVQDIVDTQSNGGASRRMAGTQNKEQINQVKSAL